MFVAATSSVPRKSFADRSKAQRILEQNRVPLVHARREQPDSADHRQVEPIAHGDEAVAGLGVERAHGRGVARIDLADAACS